MRRGGLAAAVLAALAALIGAASAEAAPLIHAHRGGSIVEGVPTYGENPLPAFSASADAGFVL